MEKIDFDDEMWVRLNTLLELKATKKICSDLLGVSQDTLKRRIEERYKKSITEFRDEKLSTTKVKLQSKAIMMALSGDRIMLIFCLKNICGWTDKAEIKHEGDVGGPQVVVKIPSNEREVRS